MMLVNTVGWHCGRCDALVEDMLFGGTNVDIWIYECDECGEVDIDVFASRSGCRT